ncbi:MAG TPA: spore coat protein [Syntrophomonas sp.]|jgi:spore coat protein CotF|nr:spore coat protein [Syntrophomonas sp.]
MLNFTQKERMLLEDQKKHEQVCVDKYNNYATQAQDPQLQTLFQGYAQQENQHLNSINQLLNGQLPATSQGNQQQSAAQQPSQLQGTMADQTDAALCNDMLMTEKYVANAYNTAIFEFVDSNVRQVLNHIQKEEQQHGEGIFNYMSSNGMYNPQ